MRKDGEEGWRKEGDGIDGDTLLRSRMKRNICIVVMNMTLARSCFGLSL